MNSDKKSNIFAGLKFDNSYTNLPSNFYEKILPVAIHNPSLVELNEQLVEDLGLNITELKSNAGAELFSGNFIAPGSKPIALAYAGHQFGHFVPRLGDGRAVLLGEIIDKEGQRVDIQLKGSGQTKFSRRGDGRAALGPVIREYIVSEAMYALGIRTTRSLAFVTTGELVFREKALPGAIITRVSSSHIRVGTFEFFAAQGDLDALKTLSDYTILRHYPECKEEENPYIALLQKISDAQARLIASWMHIGFIHGVMNTDNTSISGETIDYGPCAFMDEYNPNKVFSSIDRNGRYAYMNQPNIAQWNLARLAQSLLPLLDKNMKKAIAMAEELVTSFYPIYENYWLAGMRKKIGLLTQNDDDTNLIGELLHIMHNNEMDFTRTFRSLCNEGENYTPELNEWHQRWKERLSIEGKNLDDTLALMKNVNPAFIPRNHHIEEAIKVAVENNDFSIVKEMIEVLSQPYNEQDKFVRYSIPPEPEERVKATFCGT